MAPKNKKKDLRPVQTSATVSAPVAAPNWPPLHPLIPESHLSLQEVLPGQIVTISNLWTSTLCKNYVSFLSSLPLTTTPGKPKKGDAVRVNDRFQIDDPVFAERLWNGTALKNLVLGVHEDEAQVMSSKDRQELWGGEVVSIPFGTD